MFPYILPVYMHGTYKGSNYSLHKIISVLAQFGKISWILSYGYFQITWYSAYIVLETAFK